MAGAHREGDTWVNEDGICPGCLYGCQPYGYFPIECLRSKRIKTMWDDKTRCRHYEPCPSEIVDDNELFNEE